MGKIIIYGDCGIGGVLLILKQNRCCDSGISKKGY